MAEGEAITASIGFRAAGAQAFGARVLQQLLDGFEPPERERLYADPDQPATDRPARIPETLQSFATASVMRLLQEPHACMRALGEALSEPRSGVWFEAESVLNGDTGVRLHRGTRMLYDDRHVFINGEAYVAGGRDATLVHRLADRRALSAAERRRLSAEARELVDGWLAAGWLCPGDGVLDDVDPEA
jgi:50S ribosomal protein L16 3-hydroxylase